MVEWMRFEQSSMLVVLADIPQGRKAAPVIIQAGEQFALEMGMNAEVAFMREMPAGAEEFVEVAGMTLVRAAWVPEGKVAVTRGGMQVIDEPFRRWQVRHE